MVDPTVWIQLGESLYEIDHLSLELVRDHVSTLQERGLYERALLRAFVQTNHATWTLSDLRRLFNKAELAALRAAGDSLPGRGPLTVYRGVAGRGRDRRIRGLSWIGSIELADGFAQEHARRLAQWCTFPDPGVYRVSIADDAILAYTNQEEEQEFVVMLPGTVRP